MGGNVDKMQLTRRILDLKQVSVIKERAKELLIINRETIHMLNHILEINLYTFPHVNGLYCIFLPSNLSLADCNLSPGGVYGKDR